MSEAVSATSSFQLIEAGVERLEHSPSRPHRAWSPDLKARIIAEVADRYGLKPDHLSSWRTMAQQWLSTHLSLKRRLKKSLVPRSLLVLL